MSQQLGRITGPLLEANLVRNGVDLSFRNYASNNDFLHLDVNSKRININTTDYYDLNVLTTIRTTDLIAPSGANIAKFNISGDLVTTTTGPINIFPDVSMARMKVGDLSFIGTIIQNDTPNGAIWIDPNGAGQVEVYSNSKVNGDLTVTGSVNVAGNLSTLSRLIIGDTIYDTVTVNTDFTQDINPGTDLTYDLGKPTKRWKNIFAHSDANITNHTQNTITISDQIFIDGPNARIHSLQSNDTVLVNPTTGINYIEGFKIQDNDITNLIDNTPFNFSSTGIGYVRFMDNNAVVIPFGTTAEQPANPEVGMTRWNTDAGYLECFDGTVWDIATGGGATVNQQDMEDLANLYILVLG